MGGYFRLQDCHRFEEAPVFPLQSEECKLKWTSETHLGIFKHLSRLHLWKFGGFKELEKMQENYSSNQQVHKNYVNKTQ